MWRRTLHSARYRVDAAWPFAPGAKNATDFLFAFAEKLDLVLAALQRVRDLAAVLLPAPLRPSGSPGLDVAESNPPFAHVIGREFERDSVARQNADAVLAHLAGRIREQLVTVVQRHAETRVGQHFADDTVHFECFFLRHREPPLKAKTGRTGMCRFAPRVRRKSGGRSGSDLDFGRLRALCALLDDELHALTLGQRLEAAAFDLGEVCKQIFSAIFRRDESESFCVVEPLDGTNSHFSFLESQ